MMRIRIKFGCCRAWEPAGRAKRPKYAYLNARTPPLEYEENSQCLGPPAPPLRVRAIGVFPPCILNRLICHLEANSPRELGQHPSA